MIQRCKKINISQKNLIESNGEIIIVGDIHGQFYDLIGMMDQFTHKLQNQKDFGFLFLGNYINKGLEGIEVLIYLIALKINFPKKIQLLRGNHETRQMTENF